MKKTPSLAADPKRKSEKAQEQFPRASDIEADIKKQEETAVKDGSRHFCKSRISMNEFLKF